MTIGEKLIAYHFLKEWSVRMAFTRFARCIQILGYALVFVEELRDIH
jgi:hypothetical protein